MSYGGAAEAPRNTSATRSDVWKEGEGMDPEALYIQLGCLIEEMPTLTGSDPIGADLHRWLGRATALVEEGLRMPF
jgi:hypothetical protein